MLKSKNELMGPNANLNNSILEIRSGYKTPRQKGGQSKPQSSMPGARGPIWSPTVPENSSETEDSSDPVTDRRGLRTTRKTLPKLKSIPHTMTAIRTGWGVLDWSRSDLATLLIS